MNSPSDFERLQRSVLGQEEFLGAVRSMLMEEGARDAVLRALVRASDGSRITEIHGVDRRRLFHLSTIKAMCIAYRLRFLPGKSFKGVLPNSAIFQLRQVERMTDEPLGGFMIMAPAGVFKLCDSNVDPLLFLRVGEGVYYLVHRWGGDLHPTRPIFAWPLRGWKHLATTIFLLGALITAMMPTSLLAGGSDAAWLGAYRLLFLFWIAMVFASFTVFGWFAFFGQFSTEAWNSRHFN